VATLPSFAPRYESRSCAFRSPIGSRF
jgi:hypothetical protein